MKTQEQVVFCPVVGKGYVNLGRDYLGRRVMIVGASNYCEHYCDTTGCGHKCAYYGKHLLEIKGDPLDFGSHCERFTEVVYERYRAGLTRKEEPKWMRTFSRFYNSFFNGRTPTREERNSLLDHLVCTEYVQGSVADNGYQTNRRMMESDWNFTCLEKHVSDNKPDVVIVWGAGSWREICRRTGIADVSSAIQEVKIGGCKVTLLHVSHPASFGKHGFDRKAFQRQLKTVGVKLVQKSN